MSLAMMSSRETYARGLSSVGYRNVSTKPARSSARECRKAADFRRPTLIGELSTRLRLGLRRRRQHQRIFENDDLAHAIRIDNLETR
jgi:hypothetical protein